VLFIGSAGNKYLGEPDVAKFLERSENILLLLATYFASVVSLLLSLLGYALLHMEEAGYNDYTRRLVNFSLNNSYCTGLRCCCKRLPCSLLGLA
jgi:hypothetical protein